MTLFDLNDIASPFTTGGIKVWPCVNRPGFQWFIAYQGKPFYFTTKQQALLFIENAKSTNPDVL
jgi:hypothetical protein